MKIARRPVLPLSLVALCCLCLPAFAGDPKAEADRCSRWLDALVHGQLDKAVAVGNEHLRPEEIDKVYNAAQVADLDRMYKLATQIGSGPPTVSSMRDDAIVSETGDIIKRQIWDFGPGRHAYVGCVSYPGRENPWHLVVKFEDSPEALTTKRQNAAISRMSAPPERK